MMRHTNEIGLNASGPVLDLRPYMKTLPFWVSISCRFTWDRDGLRRYIPREAIANVLQLHRDYQQLVKTGLAITLPEPAYSIQWEQCHDDDRGGGGVREGEPQDDSTADRSGPAQGR